MIRLWTDGSITKNPGGQGGWAFVAERDGEVIHTASGGDPSSTNNRMELTAAIEAIDWLLEVRREQGTLADPIHRAELISDSQYVVFGATRYRTAWERRDWHKVKNVDLWMRLCAAVDRCELLDWRWVRGHDGAEFNEMADRLTGEASRSVDLAITRPELTEVEEFLDELAGGVGLVSEGFCRCAEPMPVPDSTGKSEIGSMCFGCDLPMDEESCRELYEDDPRAHASGRDPIEDWNSGFGL